MSKKTMLALSFAVLFGAGWGAAYAQVQTQSPVFGTVLEYPTTGCGGAVLQVPLSGQQLLPKTGLVPSTSVSFYGQAAALHVKWLTTLQCKHTGITHELVPAAGAVNTANISNDYISANWSGYQIANTAQFAQSGWTIPTVVKPDPGYGSRGGLNGYYSSTWTGIGGGVNANSGPLIQSGSTQNLTSAGPDYYFWYEIVGGPTETRDNTGNPSEVRASLTANPGDVAGSASLWIPDPNPNNPGMGQVTLGVCDFTVGGPCANLIIDSDRYTTPTPGNTTEWIVEAPSYNGNILALADFDSATFVNACWSPAYNNGTGSCYTIAQGSYPGAISIENTVFGIYQYLASPDSLNASGNGFTDYYIQPEKGN